MQKHFEILNATRNNILKILDGLSLEELNTVPNGFKNNIIWNVAHIIVTQQLLCYKLSGLEMYLNNDFVDRYKKGSEVDFEISQEELNVIKQFLLSLPEKLEKDYANGIFKSFAEYPTSYNFTLTCLEDAIMFNNVHEGLHIGYILAMKKGEV